MNMLAWAFVAIIPIYLGILIIRRQSPDQNAIKLIVGAGLLFLSANALVTGEARLPHGVHIYRSADPTSFWSVTLLTAAGGVAYLGIFIFRALAERCD